MKPTGVSSVQYNFLLHTVYEFATRSGMSSVQCSVLQTAQEFMLSNGQ